MRSTLTRRELLAVSVALGTVAASGGPIDAQTQTNAEAVAIDQDRIRGLLIGSMIGDALGGPIEFQKSTQVIAHVLNCRGWQAGRRLTSEDLQTFANSLKLISYKHFRPQPEAYGQWRANSPRGTITDDTRHKMVLINSLQTASAAGHKTLNQAGLAQAYLDFANEPAIATRPEYSELCEESNREFRKAANWVLGNRDLQIAAPPDRIWGGTPTCCGQMTMLPLAALYPGRPNAAYQKTYELSFFDVGAAKDINAALVAGLATALKLETPNSERDRRTAWKAIIESMRSTDPYRYEEVPFVERPTVRWLNLAHRTAKDAKGQPKRLYKILLEKGQVKYFWESHFILALVFSTIEFCDYDPLAALAMILDFGHDTDSGAQLLGAFIGAIHGSELFADHLQEPVLRQLKDDYDITLQDWVELLSELSLQY